jgi:uncharacterized protein (DUF1015 family)
MARIYPFYALRPPADKVAEVASVPYDVVNTDEARALADGQEWSFLHVSRPEIDLPEGVNLYSDEVYAKAGENFARFQKEGALQFDTEPAMFVYRQQMGEHIQTGVVACASVDEYDANIIKKHEKTRRDKEDDRTRHILTLRAQTGPVFLTYRGRVTINEMIDAATQAAPLYDFTAPDGIRHTVWRVLDYKPLREAFREVHWLYIADGHHRAASASRARAELRAAQTAGSSGATFTGEEECNTFLTVLFPAEQLRILPYNRVVKDLNGLTEEEFLDRVRKNFIVTDNAPPTPAEQCEWSMYLGGRWYGLVRPMDSTILTGIVESLDVSVLQDYLLAPILNIQDVRTDKRIDFVGGIRGTDELEKLVDAGRFAVAFSLYPTTVDDLMNVSDADQIMPPKSTWFEPKLRDALLIHCI